MRNADRILRQIPGICVGLIALAVYWVTADGGASFWDCPEYITCASLLEVGHPPGNPVWVLAMRAATLPFGQEMHAVVINRCSGVLMALAVWCLYHIIFEMMMWLMRGECKSRCKLPSPPVIAALCASAGALIFAFCDTTWYSAVEAEVYDMSTFMSALCVWLMIIWAKTTDVAKQTRLLILISYIMGLSLGVHQLNLLCIPVLAMIYVYRRNPRRNCGRKLLVVILLSFVTVGGMLVVVLDLLVRLMARVELLFVNGAGLPEFSGVAACWLLIAVALIATGIMAYRHPRVSHRVGTVAWMTFMVFLGFSSFALILIRGYAAPPMNEGAPGNIFALKEYIGRSQYGSRPLIYGPTPYSAPMLMEDWKEGDSLPTYTRYALEKKDAGHVPVMPGARLHQRSRFFTAADSVANRRVKERGRGYLLTDYSFTRTTTPELDMWFPRITGSSPSLLDSYENWVGMNRETMARVAVSEAIDTLGNPVAKMNSAGKREKKESCRPTYLQNLQMLCSYQIYYMYLRYLLWNFVGRQNDVPSSGEIDHGNFITGISFIDDAMLGTQELMPAEAWKENAGHRAFYGVPLLIGLAGIIFLQRRGRKGRRLNSVITMLFLMTGVAIVVYLNQTPGEPRERDYTFIVSFMAFCIWIAFGFAGISRALARAKAGRRLNLIVMTAMCAGLTLWMAVENYPDHNRAGRNEVSGFASDVFRMADGGVIFSYGDNFTFPLWFAKEVEGEGKGFQVVDVSYLATPQYVVNLMKQRHPALRFTATPADVAYSAYTFTRIARDADRTPVAIVDALKELYSQRDGAPEFRHSRVMIPGRTMADTVVMDLKDLAEGGLIPFRKLMLLDIVGTAAERASARGYAPALYFMTQLPAGFHSFLKPWQRPSTFADVYAPWQSESDFLDELARATIRDDYVLSAGQPYLDPATAGQYRRRRGGLVRAARYLLDNGREEQAMAVADRVGRFFPYSYIGQGNYTVADSTYHEGLEYVGLQIDLAKATADSTLTAGLEDILMEAKDAGLRWKHYRASLPAWRRIALSNSSCRDMLTVDKADALLLRLSGVDSVKTMDRAPVSLPHTKE